jgi:hypothetical protein
MEQSAGPPTTSPRPTIPRRVIAGIVAAYVVLALLTAVIQLGWARHHMLAGASELNSAIATVKSPAALAKTTTRDAAITDLQDAQSEFQAARDDLDLWAPALDRMGWVPHYGNVIRAAAPVASAAYDSTSSALDIVDGSRSLLSQISRPSHGPIISKLVRTLIPGQQRFAQAERDATEALSSLNAIPASVGSTSLDADLDKLRKDVPRLHAAATWLSLLPTVLGSTSPQRYIFCWENSSEIRPAGGFIGAVDLVTLRHGSMTRKFTGSAIENGHFPQIQPPVPEAVTTVETKWIFRDSNVSPSFPMSARLERWFYERDTGVHVDGVIDFVDQGVPDILSATGPIYLKQYHVTVTSHNAEALANRFASENSVKYRGPIPPGGSRNLDTYRKQFLGFEFAAILHRLQTLPPNRWGALSYAMEQAIQRKDILMWSANPAVENAVKLSGADGTLRATPGDFLYITDDNRSYNKIGPYVHESASYRADLVQGYWLDSVLTLKYHLDPSPSWMEGFGPGLGTLGNKHQFRDFVRVFVPPGAIVQGVPGLNQTAPLGFIGRSLAGQTAYGLTEIGGWFTMNPGETKVLRIRYAVPANDFSYDNFRQYRLTVLRQPGTRLPGVSVKLRSLGGERLQDGSATPSSSFRTWLALTGDRSISLAMTGNGTPNLVTESPPSRGDPMIFTKDLPGLG